MNRIRGGLSGGVRIESAAVRALQALFEIAGQYPTLLDLGGTALPLGQSALQRGEGQCACGEQKISDQAASRAVGSVSHTPHRRQTHRSLSLGSGFGRGRVALLWRSHCALRLRRRRRLQATSRNRHAGRGRLRGLGGIGRLRRRSGRRFGIALAKVGQGPAVGGILLRLGALHSRKAQGSTGE